MYDVIVIGAGPAGLMASITASKNNKKVLLIEKNNDIGKKLSITGGGRCNLTNNKPINTFISELNNKFLYSSLSNFGPKEIIKYFNNLNVELKEEEDNKIFPVSNKSKTIIDALKYELNDVELKLNEYVISIEIKDDLKIIKTNNGIYKSNNIIIATGGLTYPNTGSTGDGYIFAKSINQNITDLYPSETYLITKDKYNLEGITLENINIIYNKKIINGSLLFTHVGLTGPSIFKISEYVYKDLLNNSEVSIFIDLIPKYKDFELSNMINKNDKIIINDFLKPYLPKRLNEYICGTSYDKKIMEISKKDRNILINKLKRYEIKIVSTGPIEQAFVTGGGVDTKYINPKTMESTINKGIYFVGEVLDVHGNIGGYNITIALSTGYTAAINVKN